MKYLIGFGAAISSALTVYLLHSVLKAEQIPIVFFLISFFIVLVDYPRIYFYLIGMILYPLVVAISLIISRDQSIYPIIVFYESSMVVMILFGAFLAKKFRSVFLDG